MPNPFYAGQPDYIVTLNSLFNQVQGLSSGTTGVITGITAPTSGSWTKDQYVKNTNRAVLGAAPDQYIVDGWLCVQGGTPGVWMEVHYPVFSIGSVPPPGSGGSSPPPPAPSPTPAPPAPAPAPSAGPYASGLPPAGPASAPATTSTDASGATTINGLITAAGVNGTVTIPGNIIYTISTPIVPLAGQTIQAAIGTNVVLKAANGYTNVIFDISYITNVRIQNLTIDGNYANRTAQEGLQGSCLFQVSHGSGHTIQSCAINNAPSYGVWVWGSPNITIRLNTGTQCYQPVLVDGSSLGNTGIIEGNVFSSNSSVKSLQGIEVMYSGNVTIKSNTLTGFGLQTPTSHGFEGTWGNSIYISTTDVYLVENNTCTGPYWSGCVCGSGAANGTVKYNYFDRGTYGPAAASFWYEQPGANNLLCTRNIHNGGVSMGDTGGNNITFTFNQISCDEVGMDVNSGCITATITDNTVTSRDTVNADNGCFLWAKTDPTTNVQVLRNTFTKFLNAVFINNGGGTGTFYGLTVQGNTFVSCTNGVAYPGTLTVHSSNSLQGYSTPYSAKVQAESMTGASLQTAIAGYTGTGYSNWATAAGVQLSTTFSIPTTATYDINIRYFNYGDQLNYVQVDSGTLMENNYPLSSPNWNVLTISNVSMTAGTRTVKLISEYGYTYYDYVEVVSHSASAPAPAPAPAPGPAPSPPPGSPPFFPIGSRVDGAYPYGVKPTQSNAAMDSAVKSIYDLWKLNRLKAAPSFVATAGVYNGQTISTAYYVDSNNINISAGVRAGCVSEGIGYGMLFTVIMAGYDPNAKVYYDGLFKLARARPAYAMTAFGAGPETYLMDWRLGTDMSHQGGGWDATDGDLDIAYSLLMAHRQWGSTGTINYWLEAQRTIAALKLSGFDPSTGIMYVGGGKDVSRTSDYMAGHFRAFKNATGDTFWDGARTNSYTLVNKVINQYSFTSHLPPGWIWQPLNSNSQPSPGGRIESSIEGIYDANAVRTPMRWGTDFVWSGDSNWGTLASNITATIKGTASNSPNNLSWSYLLNGTANSNLYYDCTTASMTMVGGMASSGHQAWIDACWNRIVGSGGYDTNYYNAELTLFGLIVASGNWWRPV